MINFSNLGTTIFATGLGMTILNKFQDIWGFVTKYIKIGYCIYTSDENNTVAYNVLTKYLLSIKSKSLSKSSSFDIYYKAYDSNSNASIISKGVYMIRLKWNLILTINSTYERNDGKSMLVGGRTNHILNVKIYGIGAKEKYNEIVNMLNTNLSKDKLVVSSNGSYQFIDKRTFDTIYHQKKDEIIKFLDNFKQSKDLYIKNELVYKTGLLLYGAPGTGKTSIIKAIANYMNYKILIADTNFNNNYVLDDIEPKTIIVFEDIDKILYKENKTSNDNNSNDDKECITNNLLHNVMQMIDGLNSQSDIIYIATTNYIEKLPPELIRDGRFDCKVKLDNITKKCAEDMCAGFKLKLTDVVPDDQTYPINPSYLQKLILDKINYIKEI